MSLPLDCMLWRKIVLDKGHFVRFLGGWVRANSPKWQMICQEVPCGERRRCGAPQVYNHEIDVGYTGEQRKTWNDITIPEKNHPLVEKGIAFWMDEKTLIIGYKLLSNPKIYKPIFQQKREYMNFKLRNEIRKFAKFYAAHKRQVMYYETLMDIEELRMLPECIIIKIAHLTYDPFSYLKL